MRFIFLLLLAVSLLFIQPLQAHNIPTKKETARFILKEIRAAYKSRAAFYKKAKQDYSKETFSFSKDFCTLHHTVKMAGTPKGTSSVNLANVYGDWEHDGRHSRHLTFTCVKPECAGLLPHIVFPGRNQGVTNWPIRRAVDALSHLRAL